MSGSDSGKIGTLGEDIAAEYLIKKGYTILRRNYHIRGGEIDIIATDNDYIIFAEVKARNDAAGYAPSEAVDLCKQRRIIKCALQYLNTHPTPLQPRMDIIEIIFTHHTLTLLEVNHIENAFCQEDGYAPY